MINTITSSKRALSRNVAERVGNGKPMALDEYRVDVRNFVVDAIMRMEGQRRARCESTSIKRRRGIGT